MFDANNKPLHKHPFYRLFKMSEEEVQTTLSKWTREEVIAWLKWNDPSGCYADEESLKKFGALLSHEEGCNLIVRQVFHNSDDHDPAKGSIREPEMQVWGAMYL